MPHDPEEPELAHAVAGLHAARELYEAVQSRLPGETQPGARAQPEGTSGT
jgi:hypothetical protein